MKKIFAGLLAVIILVTTACNNNKRDNQHDHNQHDHDSMNHDKMPMDSMKEMKHDSMSSKNHGDPDGSMLVTKARIGNVDPVVKKFINTISSQYLFIKNGLAGDNMQEAKTGANQLISSLKKFDKSLLTAQQKKEFDKHTDDIKDQLEAIISGNNIAVQRASFSMLSQHIYEMVKMFGTDKVMYYDHCPMAFNNKGAMWLSETKEIKNPYFGINMLTCGTVQEIIQ